MLSGWTGGDTGCAKQYQVTTMRINNTMPTMTATRTGFFCTYCFSRSVWLLVDESGPDTPSLPISFQSDVSWLVNRVRCSCDNFRGGGDGGLYTLDVMVLPACDMFDGRFCLGNTCMTDLFKSRVCLGSIWGAGTGGGMEGGDLCEWGSSAKEGGLPPHTFLAAPVVTAVGSGAATKALDGAATGALNRAAAGALGVV